MSHTITIPAAFRPVLTEAMLTALQSAAEGVERAGFDPESYPEPLEQFDRARAALDALGWGARGEIDVETHRAVLVQALRVAAIWQERHELVRLWHEAREGLGSSTQVKKQTNDTHGGEN
ncbi:MAG TPA: hypothetical protein VK778_16380 [Solirubrobacteraceae bacterium]|jgi:hypothetical protein|nr:hypothetical protein [Solirubrobacteraceae bacterium]